MSRASKPLALFVINNAEFFLSHKLVLAQALLRSGLDVTVVAPHTDRATSRLYDLGIGFQRWEVSRRGVNPAHEARSVGRLTAIYRQTRPALVHHFTAKPVLYGSLAARAAGVPAVVNAITGLGYAFIEGPRRSRVLLGVVTALHKLAHSGVTTRSIFQNPEDRARFVESGLVPSSQARLIPGSGVDPQLFAPRPDLRVDPPSVIVPARMLYDKGIAEAVEAARILKHRGVPVEIRLAGAPDPGNPRGIEDSVLREWQREGAVRWLGHVDDMVAEFQRASIACLPSYREGFPKALIEAASCGLPIVTTDVPGCKDIVTHGDNGLLVPPRRAVPLADALESLVRDPERRERMGVRGRQRVLDHLTVAHVVASHLTVYRELLGPVWPRTLDPECFHGPEQHR